LQSALVVAEAQAVAVRREVTALRNALALLGVDIVLLKGSAYLMGRLPAARGRLLSDIDILLPFDRLAAAERALNVLGWSTTHHDTYDQRYYRRWMHELPPLKHHSRATVLDIHHAILPRTARVCPDSAKLIAASTPIAGESGLRVLCPEDMVLHSVTHLMHNEELSHGLRDLSDVDGLLAHFGSDEGFWRRLPQRADELGLSRQLYYGLRFAARCFGTAVPDAVQGAVDRARPPRPIAGLMDALYDRVLQPAADLDRSIAASLSRQTVYLRAHWLRMPPHLLAWHLAVKATRREEKGQTVALGGPAKIA
jgi:hypothetical protein